MTWASDFVTVEHLRRTRDSQGWADLSLQLYDGDLVRRWSVRNATLDVTMSKEEFRDRLPFWDENGVYAVFTRRGPLGFRATDLGEPSRYRALTNYGWTLELAVGGAAWGTISSPDRAVIEQLKEVAGAYYGGEHR